METARRGPVDRPVGPYAGRWVAWPVFWQAVWVGALATALVMGLIDSGGQGCCPPAGGVREVGRVQMTESSHGAHAASRAGSSGKGLRVAPRHGRPPLAVPKARQRARHA
jgi:hypothetical protein